MTSFRSLALHRSHRAVFRLLTSHVTCHMSLASSVTRHTSHVTRLTAAERAPGSCLAPFAAANRTRACNVRAPGQRFASHQTTTSSTANAPPAPLRTPANSGRQNHQVRGYLDSARQIWIENFLPSVDCGRERGRQSSKSAGVPISPLACHAACSRMPSE